LADYNRYDCVSTRRLRDWLIGLAKQAGVLPAPPDDPETRAYEPSPLSLALQADALQAQQEGRDGEAFRVAAAAIDYYPREAKSFWQGHFQRLREPVSIWESTRDVLRIDAESITVYEEWGVAEGQRVQTRVLRLCGAGAPGSTLGLGGRPFAL